MLKFILGRRVVNTISATRMTTKANLEKNDTDADGHGQDRVTGPGGQGHAKNVRDRVTAIVTAEDEKPGVIDVLYSCFVLWSKHHFVIPCCEMFMSRNHS